MSNEEAVRRRGVEYAPLLSNSAPLSTHSLVRRSIGRLRHTLRRPRNNAERIRLLFLLISLVTLLFVLVCVCAVHWSTSWRLSDEEVEEEWLRQHIQCPADVIRIPSTRASAAAVNNNSDEQARTYAFAASDGSDAFGNRSATVAGLESFCASRVAAVPQWAAARWRFTSHGAFPTKDGLLTTLATIFNLTITPLGFTNATYTVTGSPVCLYGGGVYLTPQRIDAGGVDAFEGAGITVLPLTDAILQKVSSAPLAGVHMVPAMGLFICGYWIATHFFHLVTDALETLYGAFNTMEGGILQRIPTQTVMMHNPVTNWIDRRGDTARKMEFSVALTNAFSSPTLRSGSPYNTSFAFALESQHCVRRAANEMLVPDATATTSASAAAASTASALCFCDGLLVSRHHHPFLNPPTYYGIQDWTAQEFRAPPYVERRIVWEMERLRLRHAPSWAARFWREDAASSAAPPVTTTVVGTSAVADAYRPRVLFIHRTTRLIANATRYAAWMRETGFRVEEVYLEKLSAQQQYHLGRYADVVVGMHGLGIGHAFWMERQPYGCRTVIEFRPWVIQSMPVQPLRLLGQTMKYRFDVLLPYDVQFGPSVKDPQAERELLLTEQRLTTAFAFSSFTDQVAIYNDDEVRRVILAVRQHLDRCLPK